LNGIIIDMIGAGILMRLGPYIIGGLGVLFVLGWIYNIGYSAGVEKVEAQIELEQERQREVNELAQEEAREMEIHLRTQITELEAKGRRHATAAASDPTAGRVCMSIGGVRRLNGVE